MARTLKGNLTGKAAHGTDDTMTVKSSYATQIEAAQAQVNAIYGMMKGVEIMMSAKDGELLEVLQAAINEHEYQQALAHIDELAGDEPFTTYQMIDGAELPFELDGTYPSPIISGGDVYEMNSVFTSSNDEDIPF